MIEFISEKWLSPLFKKLLEIHRKRTKNITAIADIFGDPLLLAKHYIQPNCQHHNPADQDEDEGRSLISSPVFKTVNSFLNSSFHNHDGRSQMFILSDAGMGKTSLLMMLKLAHLTEFWPIKFKCELLKLDKYTLTNIRNLKNKSRTVLLLDALDEDPSAWGRLRERLMEILVETTTFRNLIITCRTQFFPEKELDPFGEPGRIILGGYRCPMLFLSLFDEDLVTRYLQNRFPKRWKVFYQRHNSEMEKTRLKAITILDCMGSLRLRPLLLSHIEDLVKVNTVILNSYQVYDILIDVWLCREERKLRNQKPVKAFISKLKRSDLLEACIIFAEYMQLNETRCIEASVIRDLVEKDARIEYLSSLKITGRSLLNRDSSSAYRFSHYSIQEFLLAKGIATGYLNKKEKLIRVTDQILTFLEQSKCERMGLFMLDFRNFSLGSHFKSNRQFNLVFNKVSMVGVDLQNAYLVGADLTEANLTGANLSYANLKGANLTNAKLRGANLTSTNLEGAKLHGTDLTWANLVGSNLSNAYLNSAILENADFLGARIGFAEFVNCNTNNTSFAHTTL